MEVVTQSAGHLIHKLRDDKKARPCSGALEVYGTRHTCGYEKAPVVPACTLAQRVPVRLAFS